MSFIDTIKKKLKIANEKTKTIKEDTKKPTKNYTTAEMDEIGNKIIEEVIKKIGKGEFEIGYDIGKYPKFYSVLYLDKNTPMFNSLFRDLFWCRNSDYRTFIRKYENYENMTFDLRYRGLVEICKEIAKDYDITVELTDWSVENIIVSYDENVWSSWDNKYIYKNKKTLADYAREKCFAW